MPRPEAAVDENNSLMLPQNNVWAARQPFPMKPKSESHPVQSRSHDLFRRRVLPANPAHVPAPPSFVSRSLAPAILSRPEIAFQLPSAINSQLSTLSSPRGTPRGT